MFDRLLTFLRDLPGDSRDGGSRPSEDDPRIAAVALMFHLIDADGIRADSEKKRLEDVLRSAYSVSGDDLKRLISDGEKAGKEAVDLYAFTSVLKRNLDLEARIEFTRLMWEMVYADGERHELEDNLVWRIAELIGVERADRIAMRQSVEAGSGGEYKQ